VSKHIHLTRRSAHYWRVTIDHPPLNIFGPDTIPQLDEVITAIESDQDLKVVVFGSAIDGFFLTHYDFLAKLEDTTSLPPGPTGLQPLPDMLVRLSRAPVVSIASIRGRATGVGSELALACDMRFASREKAILSHFEVGAGVVPGGSRRSDPMSIAAWRPAAALLPEGSVRMRARSNRAREADGLSQIQSQFHKDLFPTASPHSEHRSEFPTGYPHPEQRLRRRR
jgi:Enoyl-CoA hydratase/isomerase